MVDIHLLVHGSDVPFLSIPLADVQRLSIRPFKWLRFVLFAICGTVGELSATPDGKPVDYHSTELGVDDAIYYFKPSGEFIFIDLDGLNDDKVTLSTDSIGCCTDFRKNIMERDGFCVITQQPAMDCDAVHLIPSSKSNDYIQKVVQDRSPLYGPIATISGIDAIENGIFLSKHVHAKLERGAVAFVKAPNLVAGLDPTDIQGYGSSTEPDTIITLQQLKKPHDYNPHVVETLANLDLLTPLAAFINGASVNAVFQGTPPPAVILDYMYGVAAYKYWGSKPGRSVVERYHLEHYAQSQQTPTGHLTTRATLLSMIWTTLMILLPQHHREHNGKCNG